MFELHYGKEVIVEVADGYYEGELVSLDANFVVIIDCKEENALSIIPIGKVDQIVISPE